MLSPHFVYLGALLNLYGSTSYAIDTLRGKTQPNRVTWFMWALAPLVAFGAEVDKGVGIQSLMTFMVGFGPVLVLLASLANKHSVWKLSRLDVICGCLSLLGLFLWWVTREGNIAIIFSITADGLAALPTVVKSYREPESESYLVFLFGAISALLTMLTLEHWNLASAGFPLYIFLICFLLFVLIRFKIGDRLRISRVVNSQP